MGAVEVRVVGVAVLLDVCEELAPVVPTARDEEELEGEAVEVGIGVVEPEDDEGAVVTERLTEAWAAASKG